VPRPWRSRPHWLAIELHDGAGAADRVDRDDFACFIDITESQRGSVTFYSSRVSLGPCGRTR